MFRVKARAPKYILLLERTWKQPWDRLQFPDLEVVLRIESLFAGLFASIKL